MQGRRGSRCLQPSPQPTLVSTRRIIPADFSQLWPDRSSRSFTALDEPVGVEDDQAIVAKMTSPLSRFRCESAGDASIGKLRPFMRNRPCRGPRRRRGRVTGLRVMQDATGSVQHALPDGRPTGRRVRMSRTDRAVPKTSGLRTAPTESFRCDATREHLILKGQPRSRTPPADDVSTTAM